LHKEVISAAEVTATEAASAGVVQPEPENKISVPQTRLNYTFFKSMAWFMFSPPIILNSL
jgi:hypothetical protein